MFSDSLHFLHTPINESYWGPMLFGPHWLWKYFNFYSAEERKLHRFKTTWSNDMSKCLQEFKILCELSHQGIIMSV